MFKFKKKYGQNFLKNETIIDKIVSSIDPLPHDMIIEIGPGSGAITRKLKNYGCQLIAISQGYLRNMIMKDFSFWAIYLITLPHP